MAPVWHDPSANTATGSARSTVTLPHSATAARLNTARRIPRWVRLGLAAGVLLCTALYGVHYLQMRAMHQRVLSHLDHSQAARDALAQDFARGEVSFLVSIVLGTLVLVALCAVALRKERLLQRSLDELGESEQRFRELAESQPQLVWSCLPEGPCDYLSQQWLRYAGASPGVPFDTVWRAAVHPEDRDMVVATWHAAVASGSPCELAMRLRRHDGVYRWFQSHAVPLRDRHGQIVKWIGSDTDVHEARLAQAALSASEAHYRQMVQALSEGVIVCAVDGSVLACNPSAEELLGLSLAQLRALTPQPGAHGKRLLSLELPPLAEALGSGRAQRHTLVGLETPAGQQRWLMVNVAPLRAAGTQALQGAVVSLSDVSERRAADEQLRRLTQAVEQNPSSVLITEPDGRIDYVNTSFTRITGYQAAEVLGRHVSLLQSGQTSAAVYRDLHETLLRGGTWRGELVNRRKTGEVYTEFAVVAPIRQMDGQVSHHLLIQEDISERKRIGAELDLHRHHLQELVAGRTRELQQALSAQQEADLFLRVVADNLPTAIAYWDREQRLRFANQPYLRVFTSHPEQALGQTSESLFGAEQVARERSAIDLTLGGIATSWSDSRTGPDGKVHHFLGQRLPDLRQGEVRGYFLFAAEVTELKEAEQRLVQLNEALSEARDRAEHANRTKSAFVANMSHEIRTPMNAIIGLTHVMLRDKQKPAQLERLRKVSDAAQHLLGLVNDVLDLSKIEAGKLTLAQVEFDLAEVLSRSMELVLDQAHEKQLELVLDTSDCPRRLRGDPMRISQALVNLLGNAVKFTEQGAVALRVSLVPGPHDSSQEHGELLLRFEVRDTGIGIEPAQMGSLFSAFSQADTSTTRRFGGTGLGLAITRQLAQLMGGETGAQSRYGQGSRFWFTARMDHAEHPNAWPQHPDLAGRHVLVVDDLAPARAALSGLLRRLGLRVEAVGSAEQALARVARVEAAGDPFELLVIDWLMPHTDGLVLASQLAGRRHGLTPTVLVTAQDSADLRAEAAVIGIHQVLGKPVSHQALQEALLAAMEVEENMSMPMPLLDDMAPPPLPAQTQGLWAAPNDAAEQALLRRHAGTRVLVAEDNPINQEVARELLTQVGLLVDIAADGVQALEMAPLAPYALLLMDMQMPRMDGMEATRRLRRLPAWQARPIVAMTANAFTADREACLAAGMNDHIAKPVDPQRLYATVLRWLEGPDTAVQPAAAAAASSPSPHPEATGPAVPAGDLLTDLQQLPGLDLERGLHLCSGRADVYRQVLARFVTLYAAGVPELARPAAEQRMEALQSIAHSLRGATALIGATGLASVAGRIEKLAALHDPGQAAEVDPLLAEARSLLTALVIDLGQRLQPEPAQAGA